MRAHLVPRAPLGAALVAGLASLVLAGPSAEDEARRLDDTAFFVERLDKGWEPLLSDLDRSIESLKAEPADRILKIRQLADREREAVAVRRLKDGEPGEARALALFSQLAETAVDASRRPQFHERVANLLMDQADRAEKRDKDDRKALDLAKRALGHVKPFPRASQLIARLGFKVGKAFEAEEKFEEALKEFKATIDVLRETGARDDSPEISEGRNSVGRIESTTGVPVVLWLGDPQALLSIPGAKTDFTKATLTFSGGAGKAPLPQPVGQLRRMRTGNWQVTATPPGGGTSFTAPLSLNANGGDVTLLPVLPAGMVLVRESGAGDAFLIDETEWTNAQYASVTGGAPRGAANLPVAGVSYEEARAAAARSQKQIPTFVEWQRAAFPNPSDKSRRYPWDGSSADPQRHYVGAESDPLPVRSRPEGRSWCGCFDMAGNCWEWIEHLGGGWLIGGGWKWNGLERESRTGDNSTRTFDFLREPLPTAETYEKFPDKANQSLYQDYQTSENTLGQAGMRCVVRLGKPRR